MIRLKIDNQDVAVSPGSTVLQAARELGKDIPTLCHLENFEHVTSCMVCVVKDTHKNILIPACSAPAEDGMEIVTESDGIREARKVALDLLLSDHVGDCEGPCHRICPAHMNIPRMIRQIAAADWSGAIATVKRDIALPAVLGRICPAPCERGCRRKEWDSPVSICLLKRYAADRDLECAQPFEPDLPGATGFKVAVVGAGPAGLATAYHLRCLGHACTVFEKDDRPGGKLKSGPSKKVLPREVLARECQLIEELGVEIRCRMEVGKSLSLSELDARFDAVVIAFGTVEKDSDALGLPLRNQSLETNAAGQVSGTGFFAAGGAVRPLKMAVRAVAQGKNAAFAVDQRLKGCGIVGEEKRFNSMVGRVKDREEVAQFLSKNSDLTRVDPTPEYAGFSQGQAQEEALRCLHCDCRKPDSCRLRKYADDYAAKQMRYRARERRRVEIVRQHARVIYEPGKCIACGICVRITERKREKLGLAFVGRGFDVRTGVPFDETLQRGLEKTAEECINNCPTAALALR